ncbi:MAG: cell division protein FtsH [Proteobacteria bacterium SG_bin7]|nr:MAG: cell division protein FtsH [Proteobacteria bacterium SG_bin7]
MAKKKTESKVLKVKWTWLIATIFVLIFVQNMFVNNRLYTKVTYSEFLNLIEENKVTDLVISDNSITGKYRKSPANSPEHFSTVPVKDDKLIERLTKKNILFQSERPNPFWTSIFSWLLPFIIFYFIWIYLVRGMDKGPSGLLSMTKSRAKVYMEKNVQISFADVAGVEEAKEELKEIINYLQKPTLYTRLGGRAPKGVLLVGPPGTGKTLMAKAVAGEAKVPFFSINGSEFVEMFVGLGAARVRDLFEQTRAAAPCILFIDEIDALGKSRSFGFMAGGSHEEKEQTLNQLLAEMDGFDSSEGVIILAATNRPEILDPALLRAGRFDKQVLIGNPDQHGRLQILKVHAKKIKLDPNIKVERIAALTSGFSGADLANLVNEAAIIATRRNAPNVTEKDFVAAIERLVAGLEQRKKVMNQEEKRRIAFHEMGHATIGLALNTSEKIHKVSIVPRGIGALGYTLQMPTEDRYLISELDLLNRIAVLLGGRASELINFNNVSTGATDDLAKATDIARAMITQYGMSEKLGLPTFEASRRSFLHGPLEMNSRFQYSEKTAEEIDLEIRRTLDSQFERVSGILQQNKKFLNAGAELLLQQETIDEKEITELWQKHGRYLREEKKSHG